MEMTFVVSPVITNLSPSNTLHLRPGGLNHSAFFLTTMIRKGGERPWLK